MVERNPVQPSLKAGLYDNEVSQFTDLNILLRNFMTKKFRPSLSSPPLLKDIGELECVMDKTLLRIYFKIDNTLRYIQLT